MAELKPLPGSLLVGFRGCRGRQQALSESDQFLPEFFVGDLYT